MSVYVFHDGGVNHVSRDGISYVCGSEHTAQSTFGIFRSMGSAWVRMDARPDVEHCPECMVSAASEDGE